MPNNIDERSLNLIRPNTRKRQFNDALKHKYGLLIKLGFVHFLFAIPLFATLIIYAILGSSLSNAEADSIMYLFNDLIYGVCLIIGFVIFAISIGGTDKIYKLLCWDEPVIFWSDFKSGVKENAKKNVILCLIFSFILVIGLLVSDYLTILNNESGLGTMVYFLYSSPVIFVILPLLLMMLIYNSYYKDNFKNMFKNSIKMMVYRYLPFVLFVIPFILFIVLYALTDYIYLIIYFLLVIFIGPIYTVALHLYVLSVFDFYINSNYKEYYKKGLYQGELSHEEN